MSKLNADERKIVTKILGHVEKNCAEVAEVEEYLWQMIELDEDMRDCCKYCGVTLFENNTSASSMHDNLCHTCENDSNS